MSIDNVNARISEIEARIAALSPQVAVRAQVPQPLDAVQPHDGGGAPAAPVQPFNVALAAATGGAKLEPTSACSSLAPAIESLVQKYSTKNGLDPQLVRAVITAESDGDTKSVSSKGAKGLMQLMPDEVKAYGLTDPFDPEQNIAGGTRQLAEKLKLFGGDVPKALAAYNAGSGAVRKYGGVPPYPETRHYVGKILSMLGEMQP